MNSWIKAREGKWHKSVSEEPTFMHEEKSLCGVTFTPLNVTWREYPPTNAHHICAHCAKLP